MSFINVVKIWALLDPLTRLFVGLYHFILQICDKKPLDLKEKYGDWAVVTGSTDGVGKAYALELAKQNINLVLISRTQQKLETTREEILKISPGIKVKIIQADFSEGAPLFDKIKSELDDIPVGILVNNVGKLNDYPMFLDELPESEVSAMLNINVVAATMMTRILVAGMKERRKGAIVNMSSGGDWVPLPYMAIYGATKAFIKSFTFAIRAEYSQYGITVQCLSPYYISTNMTSFSSYLNVSSALVPDATTYARSAVCTLGKVDHTTGYVYHEISHFVMNLIPYWLRTSMTYFVNKRHRDDYFKHNKKA